MGIATLFYIGLLIVNALAILNEQRFLARIGLTQQAVSFGEQETIRYKIIHLVSAVRTLMRVPLIAVNICVILYELILG